jgi:putative phosphoesterase
LKIALLSDIHSNYAALEACYDYIDRHNVYGIIYLGDYISDCPYPQKTMSMIREKSKQYHSWYIIGNREEYMLNHHEGQIDHWQYSSNTGSLLYTYENLTRVDIEFFKECKNASLVEIEGALPLSICHGSPEKTKEQLHPGSEKTDHYLKSLKTDYLICGHTHKQFAYSAFGKTIINPGSVGIPTNHQTKTQFAVLHWADHKWQPEFLSVDYDIDRILNDFELSGLNEKAKIWSLAISKTLQTGRNYSYKCIKLVRELASKRENDSDKLKLTEDLWQEAAKQLGIV